MPGLDSGLTHGLGGASSFVFFYSGYRSYQALAPSVECCTRLWALLTSVDGAVMQETTGYEPFDLDASAYRPRVHTCRGVP